MGIVSDAINKLNDWVKGLFVDGIKSQFKGINELLTNTFTETGKDSSLVKMFLTGHPADFTGAASGGTKVWTTIKNVCDNAVVPIAVTILVIILVNDLIQMVVRGNNFKDFDDSIFIKWFIKSICGIWLVTKVYDIATWIFGFGTAVCSEGISTLLGSQSAKQVTLNENKLKANMDLGQLMSTYLITLFVHLGVMIMIVAIIIVLASRIIEIFMYLGISPVPMATMLDSNDWGQIGKNWVRQILSLSFQGFFIIIALGIFKTLFNNCIQTINGQGDHITMQLAMLLGYTAALVFTVLRTGAISKSVFNAH